MSADTKTFHPPHADLEYWRQYNERRHKAEFRSRFIVAAAISLLAAVIAGLAAFPRYTSYQDWRGDIVVFDRWKGKYHVCYQERGILDCENDS